MSDQSEIEWTDSTWNPVRGCSPVSEGCHNCYAALQAIRHAGLGRAYEGLAISDEHGPRRTGKVRLVEENLELPLHWRKPRRIFVDSMADLLHPSVPDSYIMRVFDVMGRAYWHTFQILTKRAERLAELAPRLGWAPNVWMGTSIELAKYSWRAECLRQIPAAVRFLSVEPLLGPIEKLPLDGIDWVIVGGESGPYSGPHVMQPEWVRSIRDQCVQANVPFFFKQWGGLAKKKTGRELDGRTWDEYPNVRGLPLEVA